MHLNFNLSKKIISWYDNNKRTLPWRIKSNYSKRLYYRILSEFMLQQTQVKTVIPYFIKFTKEIKTLKKLAQTNERKVLKLWEGLGYYRRAKNLLKTAKILEIEKESVLPKTLKEIKKLPGIGDYTGNILLAFNSSSRIKYCIFVSSVKDIGLILVISLSFKDFSKPEIPPLSSSI